MLLKPNKLKLPKNFEKLELTPRKRKHLYAALTVLSLIYQMSEWIKKFHIRNKHIQKGWVNISFKKFERILSCRNEWPEIRDFMIDSGLIEFKRIYTVGVKAMEYRISPALMCEEWEFMDESDLFPDYRVGAYRSPNSRAYREFTTNPKELKKELLPSYDEISAEYSKTEIITDDYLKNKVKERAAARHEKCKNSKNKYQKSLSLEYCIAQEYEYIRRAQDHKSIGISKVNGRMHNPFTSLPKDYRCNIRYGPDKEILWSVDCVSFQPSLMIGTFYNDSEEDQKEKQFCFGLIKGEGFNEFFARLLGVTRAEVKTQLFSVLFGTKYSQNTPLAKMFKLYLPRMSMRLDEIRGRKEYRAHAKIAIAMQRLESDIMIQGVLKEFYSLYPGRPAFPIHDSFLVLKEDIETISELIRKHSILRVGFAPNLKVEKVSV